MIDTLGREREYCPERSCIAKDMKERQDAEQDILLVQVDHVIDCRHIRTDISYCEHHALRFTCRTGSKDNREQILIL